MARRITIGILGALNCPDPVPPEGQAAVERMIEYWKPKLEMVLLDKPDLIVLPECSDRFSRHTIEQRKAYYRVRGDQVRDFWSGVTRNNRCYVAYSAARGMPDGSWRNSTQILDRTGAVAGIYNKNHVVVTENTESGVLCGKDAPVFECDFGCVACAICFDLNFDALRLKYVKARPDLLIFSSMYHGGLMQKVWTYTCRAHFVSAIAGLASGVLSPVGESLASATNYRDWVTATVNLDCCIAHYDFNGAKLTALKKKYGRGVTIFDPGYLGSVLVTSETEDRTALEMMREFEIELLDDYFEMSLAHQRTCVEP